MAADLYRLAWRKNETISNALAGGHWKQGLQRLSTTMEINQYVDIWYQLQEIQLFEEPDDIKWKFSSNDIYSARSAYDAQFLGAFPDHE